MTRCQLRSLTKLTVKRLRALFVDRMGPMTHGAANEQTGIISIAAGTGGLAAGRSVRGLAMCGDCVCLPEVLPVVVAGIGLKSSRLPRVWPGYQSSFVEAQLRKRGNDCRRHRREFVRSPTVASFPEATVDAQEHLPGSPFQQGH